MTHGFHNSPLILQQIRNIIQMQAMFWLTKRQFIEDSL